MIHKKVEPAINPSQVKLVANPDNKRAILFKSLLANTTRYLCEPEIDLDPKPNSFNIFFELDKPDTLKKPFVTQIGKEDRNNSLTLIDVDIDTYTDEQALYIVTASFITCSTAYIQERIYEATGRLAPIIETPLDDSNILVPDSKNNGEPTILWYGSKEESFSIRQYVTEYPQKIEVLFASEPDKVFAARVSRADIIFLPKTFTDEDEFTRLKKVEWCVINGKFVVAPQLEFDVDGLAMDLDLTEAIETYKSTPDTSEWVLESQDILRKRSNKEVSLDQLIFALKEAPNDQFAK